MKKQLEKLADKLVEMYNNEVINKGPRDEHGHLICAQDIARQICKIERETNYELHLLDNKDGVIRYRIEDKNERKTLKEKCEEILELCNDPTIDKTDKDFLKWLADILFVTHRDVEDKYKMAVFTNDKDNKTSYKIIPMEYGAPEKENKNDF